jgi:haloalkane dehalogenase
MKVLRTPEARFDDLEDFPFASHYVDVSDNLRMHYLDEGPRDGPPILLLHGEPTWSYLYRKMVPPLAAAGFRVVVPDLIGFGKSDKPAKRTDYTYALHEQWLLYCMDSLKLEDITLFGQDWGSLLGLRIAGEQPDRFARIMISNGALPIGEGPMPFSFRLWRAFAKYSPWFPPGRIVRGATVNGLTDAETAAYDAPFPDNSYKAGARAFPVLVPVDPKDPAIPANRRAWEGLGRFEKPFLCVFGRNDPILGSLDGLLIDHVPGAQGQPHERIRGGHFIQEDQGEELANRLIAWSK